VGLAIAVGYLADVPRVVLSDARVNRPIFNVAVMLFSINVILLLYLVLYLPCVKGIRSSAAWEAYCPRVIPTMTAIGVADTMLFIRATWPVWGFLSPLILGIEFLGSLFFLHFVPFA